MRISYLVSRISYFVFLTLILGSCATSKIQQPLLTGIDTLGNKIYFSGDRESAWNFLKDYAATYDVTTLEGQIDYLLSRIQTTKFQLVRNNAHHTPAKATQFLRWKMKRPKFQGQVNTARDFVVIICAGSTMTGRPYVAILPDGSQHNMQAIVSNELDLLEEFLDSKSQESSL
jgi:hypothetical protein